MMVKNLRSVQPIAACSTAAVVATSIGIHDSRTNDHNSSRNDFYRRCLRYLLRQETDTTITSSSTSTDEVVSTSHRDPIPVLDLAVSSWQYYFQTPTTLFKTAAPIQWPLVPCLVNGTTKTFSAHHFYLDIIQLLYYYTNHHPFNIQRNLMKESYCNKNTSIILAYSPMNTTTTTTTASGQITTTVGSVLRSIPRHVVKFIQTIRDVVLVAIRATEIGVILSPFLLVLGPASTLMSSSLSHNPPQDSSWLSQKIESIMWSYLLYTVPMLGPAFVKLTQWAATRRDLFSSKICDQLSLIQTSNPVVHSWAHTDQMLREAFGSNYSQYLHIHHPKDNILGSGCVAQVYRGELIVEDDNSHPSSSSSGYRRKIPVAIKVLHPHISEKIDRDLTFMKRVAYLVETLLPSSALCAVNLPRVVEHFEDIIRRQVDLRIEAQNLREFHANFPTTNDNRTNSPTIEFPKPLLESKNVLVEELISAATEEEIEEEETVVNTSSISFFSTGAKQQQRRIIRKTTTVLPISAFLSDNSTEGLLVRKNLARPLLKSFLKVRGLESITQISLYDSWSHPIFATLNTHLSFSLVLALPCFSRCYLRITLFTVIYMLAMSM